MHCKRSFYGFAFTDGGEILEVFKRYLIVDKRLFKQEHSDNYPEEDIPVPAIWIETMRHCQDALKNKSSR